ncbi:phosphatidylserine decarboxylase family protein [Carboxylicivirga sediminis]|uniref:Phosphatidylserine decarboxylase proenzyme n=1 Tax=Carboxylicivirga sediminis TaxID=2006564 RepID=A0A941F1N9_9BACT|nr:phosphatidylserine decarboxylase family protein [Carboxylicivirga sediminis]MBR8534729.1 phosphatidylserine decarboxylase family protein [Carboxylicivirga sediminis]
MTIHKEGYGTIIVVLAFLLALNYGIFFLTGVEVTKFTSLASFVVFALVLNFFRNPKREAVVQDGAIIAPADGKVVAIEEVEEDEYLKTKCLQVSIFMSVFNVHINWFPIKGIVKYFRHHNGRFMAAYLPKSSTENERTSVVIENEKGTQILVRQVAGAMARRIVCYAEEEKGIEQGQQMGFIKFGSRVDLYLPVDTRIDVELEQKVTGRQTILGWLK